MHLPKEAEASCVLHLVLHLINSCDVLQPEPLLGKGVLVILRVGQSQSGGEGVCVWWEWGQLHTLRFFQPLAVLQNQDTDSVELQWAAGQKEPLLSMWSV